MSRFRTRLTLIFVLLIGISVTAAGIYMASTFKHNHIRQLEENMSREIMLIEQTLAWISREAGTIWLRITAAGRASFMTARMPALPLFWLTGRSSAIPIMRLPRWTITWRARRL